jgi:hypothetical protein
MLSEWERRTLQEIEQQISRETPWFQASMQPLLSDCEQVGPTRRFALSSVGAGVLATLLAAVTFSQRRRRFPPRTGRSRSRRHR